ncbi:MAG: oligosaccharide flippase family protein [Chrysiogenia bacterium]
MNNEESEATSLKRQFLPNFVSSFALIFVQGTSALVLTPFLIRHLDLELFGIVMLFVSISNYVFVFTIAMNNSAGRELILNLKSRDQERVNKTFNSLFFGNILWVLLLLPLVFLVNIFITRIFDIPSGHETSSRYLFIVVAISFLLQFIRSAFAVSSWARNRFDIKNFNQIIYFTVRLLFLVLFFRIFSANLYVVANCYLTASLVWLIMDYLAFRRLTPQIKLSFGFFDAVVLRKLWAFGFWLIVNQVGAFFFFKSSLLLTNMLLGAQAAGKYAAVMQLSVLIQYLGFSIGTILQPTFINLYADGDRDKMIRKASQAVKLMGLLMMLPVALIAGAAKPMLGTWLGKDFAALDYLLVMMLFSIFMETVCRPFYGLNFAHNKIKIPAIVTIALGIMNILLAVIFVKLDFGLTGVALAGIISLNARGLFFTPIYSACIQKIGAMFYLKKTMAIFAAAIFVTVAVFMLADLFAVNGWLELSVFLCGCTVFYLGTVYLLVLNSDDRRFIHGLLPGDWLRQKFHFLAR